MDYFLTRLPNGLTVILGRCVGVSRATCSLWIKTGSIQESDELRGTAHFLEHMIFKGTKDQTSNEYSATVTKLGGSDNAWTDFVQTHYYIVLPKENVDKALTLMAKTIFNAAIDNDEFNREKEVILEEIRMSNDSPWSWLGDDFLSRIYRQSNYRHPVLGYTDVIANLTREQMYDFYQSWYVPNNAYLVVTGDLNEKEVMDCIKNEFGLLKPKPIQHLPQISEEVMGKSEIFLHKRSIHNLYALAGFLTDGIEDKHLRTSINMLLAILSGSFSSRLNQVLVEKNRVATGVDLDYKTYIPNPMVFFTAESETVTNGNQLIELLQTELTKIYQEGITNDEFERVLTDRLAYIASLRESSFGFALWLGKKFFHNSLPSSLESQQTFYKRLKPEDLHNAAQYLFNKNRRWVYDFAMPLDAQLKVKLPVIKRDGLSKKELTAAKTKILSNANHNVQIKYLNTPYTNTIAMLVAIPGVFEQEPAPGLANLMIATLAKGTKDFTALQIAEQLEKLSANLGLSLGHSVLKIKLKVITEKFLPALKILKEIIKNASYPEAELAISRWQIEAERKAIFDSPWALALKKITEIVFPNYRLGKDLLGPPLATDKYDTKLVKQYHNKVFKTYPIKISIVGNLNGLDNNWLQQVQQVFLSKSKCVKPATKYDTSIALGKVEHIEQNKEQVVIVVSYPSVSLIHPDNLKWTLLTEILGGYSGSSRMFLELREKQGLAYAVSASRIADENTGILCAAISTAINKREQALKGIVNEIKKVNKGKITKEEFELHRNFLTYQLISEADTNMAKAYRLTHLQVCNLPNNYFDLLIKELKELTFDEFNNWCKQLNFQKFSVVTVGPKA